MPQKTRYDILTDAAFVAGLRNPGKGTSIELTEEQARYALIVGEIAIPATKSQEPLITDPPGTAGSSSSGGKPSGKAK